MYTIARMTNTTSYKGCFLSGDYSNSRLRLWQSYCLKWKFKTINTALTAVPLDPHQPALIKLVSEFMKIGLQRLCSPRPPMTHPRCSGLMAVGDHDQPKSNDKCSPHNPVLYIREARTVLELSSFVWFVSTLLKQTLKHLWLTYWCFVISLINHIWYTRLPPWKLQ